MYTIHEEIDPRWPNLAEVEFYITITPLIGLTFTVGPFVSVDAAEEYMAIYNKNEKIIQFIRVQRQKQREYYDSLRHARQEKNYDEMLRLERERISELLRIRAEYLQYLQEINDKFLKEQSPSKLQFGQ